MVDRLRCSRSPIRVFVSLLTALRRGLRSDQCGRMSCFCEPCSGWAPGDPCGSQPIFRSRVRLSSLLVPPTFRFSIYSSAAFWKANLTGESSAFSKLDRWIIIINATPRFMSIQT